MYLFLGGEVTIRDDRVIGIFDIEECSVSRITTNYLNTCQRKGQVVSISDDMPKSFIVCSDSDSCRRSVSDKGEGVSCRIEGGHRQTCYISNVSNNTINKRGRRRNFSGD